MKNVVLLCTSLLTCAVVFAQPLRLHVMGGGANYYGDLHLKRFSFQQANAAFGAGATYDISDRFTLRGEYTFGKVGADDKKNPSPNYRNRNLNFKSLIQELSLAGEYNLLNPQDSRLYPYVFAGIGVFKFSPYTFDSLNRKVYLQRLGTEGQGLPEYPDRKKYNMVQLNIPVGGGVKLVLTDKILFSIEYGLRPLFTDYLDDVSSTYVDQQRLTAVNGRLAADLAFRGDEIKEAPGSYPVEGAVRGGQKMKDFYYFGLAKISIGLDWLGGGGGYNYYNRRSKYGCPRVM